MNNPITAKEIAEKLGGKFSARTILEKHSKRSGFPKKYKPEIYQRPCRWLEHEAMAYYGEG